MNKRQVQKLQHGLYRIHWKRGPSSLAAVGSDQFGNRWIAPCNWIYLTNGSRDYWRLVASVEAVHLESHERKS